MHKVRHPLFELTRGRLLEFLREPEAIFWSFGFPVVLALGLGVAFRSGPPGAVEVAVYGQNERVERIRRVLEHVEGFEPVPLDEADVGAELRSGRVALAVTVVRDEGDEGGEERWTLSYRYDPSRPEGRQARMSVNDVLQRGLGRLDVARVEEEHVTERGSRYIDFLIPGLIGLNALSSSIWGIGYSVVLARRRRLLRQLAVTPMRRSHYLLSFVVSRMVFLVAEVVALLLLGWLVFDVTIRGSVAWVGVIVVVGGMSFMGLALCIAARPDNTEVASGWMNAVSLPMWLLSGSFFSYERFPEVVHPLIRALPLTAFNDALRATMNEGAPPTATLIELSILSLWAVATFLLALRIFQWQ